MRKTIQKLCIVPLTLIFLIFCKIEAYAANATLTGPSVVRAGDEIVLSVTIPDAGQNTVGAKLSYDSSQVTFVNITATRKDWTADINNNNIYIEDSKQSNLTTKNSVVATIKFKVNSNVKTNSQVKIQLENLAATDSEVEISYGTVTYSVTIAQPLSGVNTLSSLVVAGQTLSPAFGSNTTSYNLGEVDYSVSKLNITATPTDSKAKVTVSGNNLVVGKNTVTITVKAENGSTKNYQITVTRKQDPNYKASSNANISQITINAGQLSPTFSPDITDYITYVPYEMLGKNVDITGKAQDAKAVGVQSAKLEALVEGANIATLVCTAEDGSAKEYKITVYVMPKYNGEIPEIGEDANEPTEEPTEEETTTQAPIEEDTTPAPTEEDTTSAPATENDNNDKNDTWKIVVFTIVGVAVGFGICFLIFMLKRKNEE